MVYGLVGLAAPALEPVSLAEVKAHLRVDADDEDAYITSLVVAARELIESLTGYALITQTFQMRLDAWPNEEGAVELPRPPLQSITAIEIVDENGTPVAVDADSYEVDAASRPGRILRKWDADWPEPVPDLGGIRVTFVAGFGDAASDVPAALRQALLLLIAHWFERREAAGNESGAGLPFGIGALVRPFMPVRL